MALGGPDTRLRMIAIKQQSGIPLTDKEVKRLAQRQSVEAMYARNGWSGNGGMQGAYNDASGHFQARSMANSIGRIQGEYGENAVASVQKYNREDLIDRDRLNKANIEGRLLINQQERFKLGNQQKVYDRDVAKHNSEMAVDKARLDEIEQRKAQNAWELAEKQKAKQEAEDVRTETDSLLALEQRARIPNSPFDRVKFYESLRPEAASKKNRPRVIAIDAILDKEIKRRLDLQSAANNSAVSQARVKNLNATADAKWNQVEMARTKLEKEMGEIDLKNPEHVANALAFVNEKIAEAQKSGDTQAVADWNTYKNRVLLKENTGTGSYVGAGDGVGTLNQDSEEFDKMNVKLWNQ